MEGVTKNAKSMRMSETVFKTHLSLERWWMASRLTMDSKLKVKFKELMK
jgi:hypothetical protein